VYVQAYVRVEVVMLTCVCVCLSLSLTACVYKWIIVTHSRLNSKAIPKIVVGDGACHAGCCPVCDRI